MSIKRMWTHTTEVNELTGAVYEDSNLKYDNSVGGVILVETENPNWRQDIQSGRSATTPFEATMTECLMTYGTCESRRWGNYPAPAGLSWSRVNENGLLSRAGILVPSAPSTTLDSIVDAYARGQWIRRARNAQGAFRGSTFVAELAQAIRMVRNPAAAFRRGLDDYGSVARKRVKHAIGRDPRGRRIRDLNKKQKAAAGRALSDTWLEHQFGWLPLLSDGADAVKALNRFCKRQPLKRVYADSTRKADPVNGTHNQLSNHVTYQSAFVTHTEYFVKYYGAVKVRADTFSSDVVEEAGFRVRDFIPALWEWIPYSFLIDYFTNIGKIIEAASVPRSEIAWLSRTFRNTAVRESLRMTCKKNSNASYPSLNAIELRQFSPSTKTWRRSYVYRTEYTQTLVPSFAWNIPGLKNWRKWANMAALALGRGMVR